MVFKKGDKINTGKINGMKTRFRKGNIPWNKGKQNPHFQREKNNNWKGGKSRPYAKAIFNRAGRKWLCGCCGESDIKKLVIHHCNGNREDNRLMNLTCVCHYCHNAMHDNPHRRATQFQLNHPRNQHY